MARKAKVTEKHRKVDRALRRGVTVREALLEAGYSEATSRKGIIDVQKRVPALAQAIHEETMQQARELIAKQDHSLSKAELEQLVEAVLVRNSINGEGKHKGSSYAAKLIGSLRRVNVFEPGPLACWQWRFPPSGATDTLCRIRKWRNSAVHPFPPCLPHQNLQMNPSRRHEEERERERGSPQTNREGRNTRHEMSAGSCSWSIRQLQDSV